MSGEEQLKMRHVRDEIPFSCQNNCKDSKCKLNLEGLNTRVIYDPEEEYDSDYVERHDKTADFIVFLPSMEEDNKDGIKVCGNRSKNSNSCDYDKEVKHLVISEHKQTVDNKNIKNIYNKIENTLESSVAAIEDINCSVNEVKLPIYCVLVYNKRSDQVQLKKLVKKKRIYHNGIGIQMQLADNGERLRDVIEDNSTSEILIELN